MPTPKAHPTKREYEQVRQPCGCLNCIGGEILYCPTHAAAPEMATLLNRFAEVVEHAGYPAALKALCELRREARALLARLDDGG